MSVPARPPRPGAAFGCLLLFCLPFLGVGLGVAASLGVALVQWYDTNSWVVAPATILDAELVAPAGLAQSSRVRASYEYVYKGRVFQGDRVSLHESFDNIGTFHLRTLNELLRYRDSGEPYPCLLDPSAPASSLLVQDLRWDVLAYQALASALFLGVGVGLLLVGFRARRRLARERRLQEQHLHEPWLWRDDWVKGKIRSSNRRAAWWAVALTVFVFLLSAPIVLVLPKELSAGNWLAILGIVFPAMGIWFAIVAGRAMLRWRRFRESLLALETIPAVPGSTLEAALRTPGEISPEGRFEATLQCLQGSPQGRNQQRAVLWETQQEVPKEAVRQMREATIVSLNIPIAASAPGADHQAPGGAIAWELKVKARTSRGPYGATFEVPVFDTSGHRLSW